jgi:hypothetical protein
MMSKGPNRFGAKATSDLTRSLQPHADASKSLTVRHDNSQNAESQSASSGLGRPLDLSTRAALEPRFGRDLGNVRIHTDDVAAQSAAKTKARAFTVGNDISFGQGQYSPSTPGGQQLLAHELTHVVQQQNYGNTVPATHSPGHVEMEAESAERAAGNGNAISVKAASRPGSPQFAPLGGASNQTNDSRERIISLAESSDAADRQAALNLIVVTYYHPSSSFAGIVYEPNFVADRRRTNPRAKISPQQADTGGAYGKPQTISIGPHFFTRFRERYAQRVRTIGHELQHVEQRSPTEKEPGKRSVGSTFLGALAGAAGGALLGAAGLGIAHLAGASLSAGLIGGVLGASAAVGGIVGGIWDPFRPKSQMKEPITNTHTREFLSLHWAVTAEVPGLEQMDIGQRILTIEDPKSGALAEYRQMPPDDQKTYAAKFLELQALIQTLKNKQAESERRGDLFGPEAPKPESAGEEEVA